MSQVNKCATGVTEYAITDYFQSLILFLALSKTRMKRVVTIREIKRNEAVQSISKEDF